MKPIHQYTLSIYLNSHFGRRHTQVYGIHHIHRFDLAFCDSLLILNCKSNFPLNNKNLICIEGRHLGNKQPNMPGYQRVYNHHSQQTCLQRKSSKKLLNFSQGIEHSPSSNSRQVWELRRRNMSNKYLDHRIYTSHSH